MMPVRDAGDLKDPKIAAKFDEDGDGKADLAGCVPGWGCERVIEHHLTEYGLRDTVTHNQGEYNAIIADTISRYKNGKPILYYTWTPYFVSGSLVPGKDISNGSTCPIHPCRTAPKQTLSSTDGTSAPRSTILALLFATTS